MDHEDAFLRFLVRQLPAIVWAIDRRYRITFSRGAGLRALGLRQDQWVGRPLRDTLRGGGSERFVLAAHRRALGGASVTYEMRWHGRDYEVHLAPLRGNGGRIGGAIGVALDVTQRKHAEEALGDARDRFRRLARRLQSVREEEQARIAREIHDKCGQTMTTLKMDAHWLLRRVEPRHRALAPPVRRILRGIDEAVVMAREIAAELRPPLIEDLGLGSAVAWLARRFEARAGVRCRVSLRLGRVRIPTERAVAAFRIVQEALTNVARHARARSVRVELRRLPSALELTIRDDGVGFDVEAARRNAMQGESLGVLGMQERAQLAGGQLTIDSAPGAGTRVRVSFPVSPA